MKKIIVSDIFGKTPALTALANEISADVIVDPYSGEFINFDNEEQAYCYFTEHIGLDVYTTKLFQLIEKSVDEIILIGFSVGAAAIWKLSESKSERITKVVKQATCFYGAQIRHYTKLSPLFELTLIFPKREPHFDVLALQQLLAAKPKVTTMQADFLHGFMNHYSNNFNQLGYSQYVELLK